MGKKSEKCQRRQAEKEAKFEETKAALIEQVAVDEQPKILATITDDKTPHLAPHLARLGAEIKQPIRKFERLFSVSYPQHPS